MLTPADYRAKAAELSAKSRQEPSAKTCMAFEILARSYIGLAELAERNRRTDIVYETPPDRRNRANGAAPT